MTDKEEFDALNELIGKIESVIKEIENSLIEEELHPQTTGYLRHIRERLSNITE